MQGIRLEGVSRIFGSAVAVDGVDITVGEGEFVTLLGPSGCGKTTTLRMVAGLEHNDRGRIYIGDRLVSDPERKTFVPPDRRRLGMVFQSYAIWPHMTVFDNVAYPLRIRRCSAGETHDKVHAALRLVEMEQFADRPAPRLSGGQQQRVAIARALASEPAVMLLDEPLSNLDAKLRLQTGDEFRMLQRRLGMTTLYVTHDQSEAMSLSDRIVVMDSGRVLQVGQPEEIYSRPNNVEVARFFGTPNILGARVRASSANGDGFFTVDVEGEGWRGSARAGRAFSAGELVRIMARPENIQLRPDGGGLPPGDAVWRGRIAKSVFRGAIRSVEVAVDNGMLRAETGALVHAHPGRDVTLTAPAAGLWVIA